MTERGCSDGVQATRQARMEATKASDVTQRRVTAAKKYIEEMYKSQAQALRDRRKRRSLLEQELKQNTNLPTQVSQRYILYIYIERERGSKRVFRSWWSWETEASTLRTHGLGHHCPPPTPTPTSSKSESSLPPASCLGGGRPPPLVLERPWLTTRPSSHVFFLFFFVLSCRSRRRG